MRETRIIMGMPISVEILDAPSADLIDVVFDYFNFVDQKFSTYKTTSEISAYNRGDIDRTELSIEMLEIFELAEKTHGETDGYFDMRNPDGVIDPSGVVKGWAVRNAALNVKNSGALNYYIDAGGDIQAQGKNADGEDWQVGIRNPFNDQEVIKVIHLSGQGIATSGSYVRGEHIYNPHQPAEKLNAIVSLTVIGPDVLEADRFATAAFAMAEQGIYFIEQCEGLEGYAINSEGIATMTTGFAAYAS